VSTTDNDELQYEIQRLRKEVERLKQERKHEHRDRIQVAEKNDTDSEQRLDRRNFLKGLAGGAAGLGALGLMSNAASAYDITSSHPFTLYNSTEDKNFEVGTKGVLTTNQIGKSSNPISNIHTDTLDAERQLGSYDTLVTSTSELKSAFANLDVGETVLIARPESPYRPDGWLDIDVDNVTIIAQHTHAENGELLIKLADNSGVGGIRVGTTSPVENIRIDGVGIDGNRSNQPDDRGEDGRNHGILFHEVTSGVVENCVITGTFPQYHGDGGSGVSVRHYSQDITIRGNEIYDPGDRCIQVAGENVLVESNICYDGFDRAVSLDVSESGENTSDFWLAVNVDIVNNLMYDMDQGSAIGGGGGPAKDQQNVGRSWSVTGNVAVGKLKRLVTFRYECEKVEITGNYGYQENEPNNPKEGIHVDTNYPGAVISGNYLENFNGDGIKCNPSEATITGNYIKNAGRDGIITNGDSLSITGNIIIGVSGNGLNIATRYSEIVGNSITQAGDSGIYLRNYTNDLAVGSNTVVQPNQNGNGANAVEIHGATGVIFTGNRIDIGGNIGIVEDPDDSSLYQNLYVGNMIGGTGDEWDVAPDKGSYYVGNFPRPTFDVRGWESFGGSFAGAELYHDGSGSNTEGPAVLISDGTWKSLVDGSTIS